MKANWFIALQPSEGINLKTIIQTIPSGLRAFAPEDLHITLAFLGPCTPDEALAAWIMACRTAPFVQQLTPKALQPMGNPKRPSAAALTFDESDNLIRWMNDHQTRLLQKANRPPAKHPPLPHLTVARPKRRASESTRNSMIRWCHETKINMPDVVCLHMALYTWSHNRRERLFRTTKEYSLPYGCNEVNCAGHNHEWERCTTNGF